ncbi:DISARM anti-phage system protein DrmE domain-containing protein [Cellulomonas fengjieae]|uniref:DISARM protein DrmE C-terminal domain-containing protein n=1 Tax=Cellulomonas fengjieae TaxID=2819978 RepID=A0ABS3SEC0_9CELL|nr:hypothetical protein [Cellulomonas fengjieae]MBO3084100.1 hypothetical protein [Cellulomonas fengjieae]QVI64645.1 hypothetical protein KG102_10655 [Cellulomonas fengjieae]
MQYLDVLVPAEIHPGDLLEKLHSLRVSDNGAPVTPGPLDQATINLVREVLTRTDKNLSLEMPRGRSDIAVFMGVYLHLMRQGARLRQQFDAEGFGGVVAVIGRNTNLTERLRLIKIGRYNLSEGLSAQRVRADGRLTDMHGKIHDPAERPDWILYLNTTLGWPALTGVKVGLAVIDRASFRNPETLEGALAWCKEHHAGRIIVIGSLGDPPPMPGDAGWLRWPWTPRLRTDMVPEVGAGRACGALSTNCLLTMLPRPLGVAIYSAPELASLRRTCLMSIAAARKVGGPLPRPVADAVRLVNLLGSLWGQVPTANVWAAADPRGVSAATLAAYLRRSRGEDLRDRWASFRETHWPDLRRAALQMTDLLTECNPRLDLLLGLLDWAEANRPGARVVVRAHSRPAARALEADLLEARPSLAGQMDDGDPAHAKLRVIPYSDTGPWASAPTLELHLGAPAPWRRGALLSGEATEHVVAVDRDEERWLHLSIGAVETDLRTALASAGADLALEVPQVQQPRPTVVYGPVRIDDRGEHDEAPASVPGIDLTDLFEDFSLAVTQLTGPNTPDLGGRPVSAVPVTLEPDGAVYWLPASAQVEVLAGTRYFSTPVHGLQPGMQLLIPRGESRGGLYQRLLQSVHSEADVMAVELILRRFRNAVDELHDRFGSWDAVARALNQRGSKITTGATCSNWARGTVIAPDDIEDIRRVGRLAWQDTLLVDRTWERIGALAVRLRGLHRALGQLLSAAIAEAVSGAGGTHLQRLSDLCGGVDPTEILEEFDVRQVRSIGPSNVVPSVELRRLTYSGPRTRPMHPTLESR